MRIVVVGVCGALGALARMWVSDWLNPNQVGSLPGGTLLVNVVGSFCLGLVTGLALSQRGLSEPWRSAVSIGFLGSLTTFSTFSVETIRLAEIGEWKLAGINLGLQVVVGLIGGISGLAAGRYLAGG